jgi:hypothetical protein
VIEREMDADVFVSRNETEATSLAWVRELYAKEVTSKQRLRRCRVSRRCNVIHWHRIARQRPGYRHGQRPCAPLVLPGFMSLACNGHWRVIQHAVKWKLRALDVVINCNDVSRPLCFTFACRPALNNL